MGVVGKICDNVLDIFVQLATLMASQFIMELSIMKVLVVMTACNS